MTDDGDAVMDRTRNGLVLDLFTLTPADVDVLLAQTDDAPTRVALRHLAMALATGDVEGQVEAADCLFWRQCVELGGGM